ncbi:hypothetical protein LTR53_009474 [Teratosphaeriaceae sp. CCFEE 6253]|nr:hypothetical protein LTR53_009474 [Teratosphaeriaceae sp. CCFEE 6253]
MVTLEKLPLHGMRGGWDLLTRGMLMELQPSSQDKIEVALASEDNTVVDAALLLSWYRRAKSSLQVGVLKDRLWLNTAGGHVLLLVDDETISTGFDKVYEEIATDSSPGLRICALSAPDAALPRAFSFPYKVYLTVSGHADAASQVFNALTSRLLAQHWTVDPTEQQAVLRLAAQPELPPKQYKPELPSAAKAGVRRDHHSPEGLLRPSWLLDLPTWQESFYLEWQWLGHVPKHRNDVDIYVWEPFKQTTPRDYIRLLALRQDVVVERRILVLASSKILLQRLAEEPVRLRRTTPSTPGTDTQLFKLFLAIYRMIGEDTMDFLVGITAQIERIGTRGRSSPSAWKIQLLSHLQQCQLDVAQRCADSVRTLDMLLRCAVLPCCEADAGLYAVLAQMADCGADIDCLAMHLREKAGEVPAVKKVVREQMELASDYRNTVIAVLVALYVPISFVSSFFGMNISAGSTYKVETNMTSFASATTTTTTSASPSITARGLDDVGISNATYTTNQPGTKTWPLSSFWASAFPLAFATIIVPLVAGPVFRTTAQFASRYRVWWRVIVMFLTLSIMLGLNLMALSSEEAYAAAYKQYRKGNTHDLRKYYSKSREASNVYGAAFVVSWIELGLLCTAGLWHFWVAARLWPAWRLLGAWFALLCLTLVPILLHSLSWLPDYGLLTLLPWLALFLLWVLKPSYFYSVAEYRRHRRRRVQARGAKGTYGYADQGIRD